MTLNEGAASTPVNLLNARVMDIALMKVASYARAESDPTDRSGTVAPGEPPMRNRVTVAFDGLVAKLGLALTATLLTSLYLIAGPVAPTEPQQ